MKSGESDDCSKSIGISCFLKLAFVSSVSDGVISSSRPLDSTLPIGKCTNSMAS